MAEEREDIIELDDNFKPAKVTEDVIELDENFAPLKKKVKATQLQTSFTEPIPEGGIGAPLKTSSPQPISGLKESVSEVPSTSGERLQAVGGLEYSDPNKPSETFKKVQPKAPLTPKQRFEYWNKIDTKEAEKSGYKSLKELHNIRESFAAQRFLTDEQKNEFYINKDVDDIKKKYFEAVQKKDVNAPKLKDQLQSAFQKQITFNRERDALFDDEVKRIQSDIDLGFVEENMGDGGTFQRKLSDEEKDTMREKIKTIKTSKGEFFKPQSELLKEAYDDNKEQIDEVIKEEKTPQEKFKLYYNTQFKEWQELNHKLGYSEEKSFLGNVGEGVYRMTFGANDPDYKRYVELDSFLRNYAPISLINRNPQQDEGALTVFGKTAAKTLMPRLQSVLSTEQEIAKGIDETLSILEIPKEAVAEGQAEKIEEKKQYKPYSSNDWAQMVGTTTGIILPFTVGAGATNAVLGVTKLAKGVEALVQTGKIADVLGKSSRTLNAIQSTKVGRGLVQTMFSGLKTGTQYEAAGEIFRSQQDEANFMSGFLGGTFAKPVEKVFDKAGAFKVFKSLFGEKTGEAVSAVAAFGGAIKSGGKVTAKGLGEVAEEFGNEIGNIYSQTDSFKELLSKVEERFGEQDFAMKFFIQSFVLGAGMGAGNTIGDTMTGKAKEVYDNDFSTDQKKTADSIISEMNSELKKTVKKVEGEEGVSAMKTEVVPEGKTKEEKIIEAHKETDKFIAEAQGDYDLAQKERLDYIEKNGYPTGEDAAFDKIVSAKVEAEDRLNKFKTAKEYLLPLPKEQTPPALRDVESDKIIKGEQPVYHGTFANFEEFDPEHLGTNTGAASAKEGFFFASNKKVAESYATDNLLKYKGLEKQADKAREEIRNLTNGEDTEFTLPSKIFRESVHGVESGYSPDIVKKLKKQLDKINAFDDFQNTMDDSYFAPEGKVARSGRVKETYLDIKNPFIKDYNGENFRDEKYSEVIKKAKELGHDGVIFKNTFDGNDKTIGDEPTDIYVVFDKAQIKSKPKSESLLSKEQTPPALRDAGSTAKTNVAHEEIIGEFEVETDQGIFTKQGDKWYNPNNEVVTDKEYIDSLGESIKEVPEETQPKTIEEQRSELEDINIKADTELKEFTKGKQGAGGLLSKEVLSNPEYKALKKNFDSSFKDLQDFNKKNKPGRKGYKTPAITKKKSLSLQHEQPTTTPETQKERKGIKGDLKSRRVDTGEKVKRNRAGNRVAKAKRKIKNERALESLKKEPTTPREAVLQFFIGKGQINSGALQDLYGNKKGKSIKGETLARIGLLNNKTGLGIDAIAHKLWEERTEYGLPENLTSQDFREAVESVINDHVGTKEMVNELLNEKQVSKDEFDELNASMGNIKPEFIDEADVYLDSLTDAEKQKIYEADAPPADFDVTYAEYENKLQIETKEPLTAKQNEQLEQKLPDSLSPEEKQGALRGGEINAEATILADAVHRTMRDSEGGGERIPKENKIKSWIDKWEELKKENNNKELDLFYNKVKVALNGYAQGKGVVDEFTKLKSDIEDFAKNRKSEPALVEEPTPRATLEADLGRATSEMLKAQAEYDRATKALSKDLGAKQTGMFEGTEQKLFEDTKEDLTAIKDEIESRKKTLDAAKEKVDNLNKRLGETLEGQTEMPLTDKEQALKELAEARAAFRKAGGLSSGGLEALPEFIRVVKAAIKAGYFTAKEFIKDFKEDFSKYTDEQVEAAFNAINESIKKTEAEKVVEAETEKSGTIKQAIKESIRPESQTVEQSEYSLLKKQIRDKIKGIAVGLKLGKEKAKVDIKQIKETQNSFNQKIKEYLKGTDFKDKLTDSQVRAITNKAISVKNENQLESFLNYVDKVVEDKAFADRISNIKKISDKAKSKKYGGATQRVRSFLKIKPESLYNDYISESKSDALLEKYEAAVNALNQKVPSLKEMDAVIDEIIEATSIKEEVAYDYIKSLDDANNALTEISLANTNTIEDYKLVMKNIKKLKKSADALLENGDITPEQHEKLIVDVDKKESTDELAAGLKKQIDALKDNLIAEGKSNLPLIDKTEFNDPNRELATEFADLKAADLKNLSVNDLEIYNQVAQRMNDGYLPIKHAFDIVVKTKGIKQGSELAGQFNEGFKTARGKRQLLLSESELKKKLGDNEMVFIEGMLGIEGSAGKDALTKYVSQPLARAITAMENAIQKTGQEFLRAKQGNLFKGEIGGLGERAMTRIGIIMEARHEAALIDKKLTEQGVKVGNRDIVGMILGKEAAFNALEIKEGKNRDEVIANLKKEMSAERQKYTRTSLNRYSAGLLGTNELGVLERAYESLPKKADGTLDVDATKLTEREQRVIDATEKIFAELADKQEQANAIRGLPFNRQEYYFRTMRKGIDSDIEVPQMEGGKAAIAAKSGKEKVTEKAGAKEYNIEKLLSQAIVETNKDYHLTKYTKEANSVLNRAGTKLDFSKTAMDAVKGDMQDRINHQFDRAESYRLINNIIGARYWEALLDPFRVVAEVAQMITSAAARGKFSGFDTIVPNKERKVFIKLLQDTNSSLGLKLSKHMDVEGTHAGDIKNKNYLEKFGEFVIPFSERLISIDWMPVFRGEFQQATGQKFDADLYTNDSEYRRVYKQEVLDAAAVADKHSKELIGPGTKAEGRKFIKVFPGKSIKANTMLGKTIGFFGSFAYRDAKNIGKGIDQMITASNKGRADGATRAFSRLTGAMTYGYLMSAYWLIKQQMFGDDEEKKVAKEALDKMYTAKGLLTELGAQTSFLAFSRYGQISRTMALVGLSAAKKSSTDKNTQQQIEAFTKSNLYTSTIQFDKKNDSQTIIKTMPALNMVVSQVFKTVGGKEGIIELTKKFEKKGWDKMTDTEKEQLVLVEQAFNTLNLVLMFGGYQVPMKKTIEQYINDEQKQR